MWGGEGQRGALHVYRVLQFSHATANSTRRQIRDSRLRLLEQGVVAEGGGEGGIGTESCLLSLHSHRGGQRTTQRNQNDKRMSQAIAVRSSTLMSVAANTCSVAQICRPFVVHI